MAENVSADDNLLPEDSLEMFVTKDLHETVEMYLFLVIGGIGALLSLAMVVQQFLQMRQIVSSVPRIRCILLINLGCSLFMESCFLTLFNGIWRYTHFWYAGNSLCKLLMVLRSMFMASTVYCIMAVLLAHIVHSIRPCVSKGPASYLMFLLPGWIVSLALSFPMVFVYHAKPIPFLSNGEQCVSYFSTLELHDVYILIMTILLYGAPLLITCVMLVLGIILRMKAHHGSGYSGLLEDEAGTKDNEKMELSQPTGDPHRVRGGAFEQSKPPEKSITPLLLAILYFFFWLPYYTLMWSVYGSHAIFDFSHLFVWFMMLGCLVNPVISLCTMICTIKQA